MIKAARKAERSMDRLTSNGAPRKQFECGHNSTEIINIVHELKEFSCGRLEIASVR